jgi:hypothetical protein
MITVVLNLIKEETFMNKEIKVKTKNGYLWATDSGDIDYPGIDVEFIADNEDENALSNPRILFEYPTDGKLRVLIWDDKNNEDYTREIIFDIQEEDIMTREQIVMKALNVEKEDAKKIVEHLIKQECEEWIDEYIENGKDNPLTDVHYEKSFDNMIDWQFEGSKPSEMLGKSSVIEEYPEMLQLKDKVIFWYGLV